MENPTLTKPYSTQTLNARGKAMQKISALRARREELEERLSSVDFEKEREELKKAIEENSFTSKLNKLKGSRDWFTLEDGVKAPIRAGNNFGISMYNLIGAGVFKQPHSTEMGWEYQDSDTPIGNLISGTAQWAYGALSGYAGVKGVKYGA